MIKNNAEVEINIESSKLPDKPSRQRFVLVLVLFLGITVAYLDRVNVAVIAADGKFLADMGIAGDPVKIGLLMTTFLAAYAISNIVLSPLGDYLGPRKAMVLAYVLVGISLLIGGIAGSFTMIIAARILLGVGEGLYYPMQNTFVKNWFPPKERGRANTTWIIGQSLSQAIAMPIFAYLVVAYSWRSTFFFALVVSLVPLFLLWFYTADTPRKHKKVNKLELKYIEEELAKEKRDKNKTTLIKETFWERAKTFVLDYRFWLLMLILATNSIISWGLTTWLPTYLNQERGFSWTAMGWLASLPFILGIFFKFITGFIIDRVGRNAPVIALSALLTAAGVFFGTISDNNYLAAVLIAFGVGASAMQIPAIFTLLQNLVPSKTISTATGTLNGIAVMFGASAPVLIGFSVSLTGNFESALYLLMGIVLFGGVLASILAIKKL
ncbi:MFS transporter [Neobacillus vireti]|uniref:MFS transporter n=1 Tax=Neobacillus vireti TaxID=220686 RepID=UPI003000209E